MIAALKVTEESKSGRQRLNRWRRAKNDQATKLRSHYQYKIWETGVEGNRVARSTTYSQNADLISTAYYNPATRTITVYALAFDLDYDKADARWKTDGKLDWLRIKAFLHEQDERVIVEKIIAATRSSSGRGIGLTLAVSPLEMIDSTLRAQRSAFALQLHVIGILNGYGMGADPAAIGLVRDQPNYHNHEKIIEYNAWQKASVDNGRVAVVSELLKYTNAHRFIRYQKKSDRLEDLLCADARVEPKLAKLYLELFENHFMKSGDYRFSELQKITALSKSTLYRYLKTPPPWLNVERLNKYEGYRLSLVLTYRLYPRACELMTGVPPAKLSKPSRRAFVVGAEALKPPAQVADGERNEYLTQVALTLKHGGIELSRAVEVVGGLVRGIPGAHSSRNCRSYAGILRSIYKNKPSLFGIKAHAGEGELLLANSKTVFSKTECPTSFKKGIPEGYSLSSGARSVDGAKRTGNFVTGQLGECEVRQDKARLFRRGLLLRPDLDVWRNRLEGEDKSRKERSVLSGTEDRSLSYPKLENLYPGLMEMDGEQNSNSEPEVTLSNLYPGLFDSEEERVGMQDTEVSEMSQSSHSGLAVSGVPSSCARNGDVRVKCRTGSL